MATQSDPARTNRPRPRAEVSRHLEKHLLGYVAAAGAGLLATAQPADAKIVYTPENAVIARNGTYNLDLNNDGIVDFQIVELAKGTPFGTRQSLFVDPSIRDNEVMCGWVACTSGFSNAAALRPGTKIGTANYAWLTYRRDFMGLEGSSRGQSFSYGPWAFLEGGGATRYLGLRFQINGEAHFGWARLTVRFHKNQFRSWEVHITGFAYETIPYKSIIAGQTTGKDDEAELRSEPMLHPSAVGQGSVSANPRFATLGALALGADGMALWRRKEKDEDGERR
jgi:hypothetical protein